MNNYTKDDALIFGALASQKANQDPIDLAFFNALEDKKIKLDEYVQKKFIPFDPSTRKTEAIVEKKGEVFRVVKGAVSAVMQVLLHQRG